MHQFDGIHSKFHWLEKIPTLSLPSFFTRPHKHISLFFFFFLLFFLLILFDPLLVLLFFPLDSKSSLHIVKTVFQIF